MNRLLQSEHLPLVDECADRLRRAGWSCGDARLASGVWLVSGTNGENVIEARAWSQALAWQQAVEQARAVGMLR